MVKVRGLIGRYWQPLLSAVSLVAAGWGAVAKLSIQLPGLGPHYSHWAVSATFFLLFVMIRFPRVAFAITRLIMGPPELPSNPSAVFQGLAPYTDLHEGPLPERQADEDRCWQLVQGSPFCIIEGESGCGKTSLLNVSLISKAKQSFSTLRCRVSDDPFGRLRAALLGEASKSEEMPTSARELLEAAGGWIEQALRNQGSSGPLLVCFDQFEELFINTRDTIRSRFLDCLRDLIRKGALRLLIVIRSDFLDLLIRACDQADPGHQVLQTGNYYTLRAFSEEQARAALMAILGPLHEDDLLLKQQHEDFARALVSELLRPPRDNRLCADDRKTVLPAELQTLGMVIERLGVEHFSVAGLRRFGGKVGLLRRFVEESKLYVSRKTGVPGAQALLILRQLVSSAQTKRTQTAESIARALGLAPKAASRALEAFAELYLVNRLPHGRETDTEVGVAAQSYELMHEYLTYVLTEAPDPILQRARDAEERLLFWKQRMHAISSPDPAAARRRLASFKALFAQPIPSAEMLRLWRFAGSSDDRSILRRNLRGFCCRLSVFLLLGVLLPYLGWTAWTYTDSYQIHRILADAPVDSLLRTTDWDSKKAADDALVDWVRALIKARQDREAFRIDARYRGDNEFESRVRSAISVSLVERGDYKQAVGVAAGIRGRDASLHALSSLVESLCSKQRYEEAATAAEQIQYPENRSATLSYVVSALAEVGRWQAALDLVERVDPSQSDPSFRVEAFCAIASWMASAKHDDTADQLWREAARGALAVGDPEEQSYLLSRAAYSLLRAGRLEWAAQLANSAGPSYEKFRFISDLVGALADRHQFDRALCAAEKIPQARPRYDAMKRVAWSLQDEGREKDALTAMRSAFDRALRSGDLHDQDLRTIVNDMGNMGMVDEPLRLLSRITGAVRAYAMCELGGKLAQRGRLIDAKRLWRRALELKLTERESPDLVRGLIRESVARSMVEAGLTKEALAVVLGMPRGWEQSSVLAKMADQLVGAGQYADAVDVAGRIEDLEERSKAFAGIVRALAEVGRWDQAVELSARCQSVYSAPEVLTDEAAQAKGQRATTALLARALAEARYLSDKDRSRGTRGIAEALTEQGRYRDARLIARTCTSADRLRVYARILSDSATRVGGTDRSAELKRGREDDREGWWVQPAVRLPPTNQP